MRGPALLEVDDLVVHYPARRDMLGRVREVVHAVDGISLRVEERRTLALVGESGSGKTTVARAVLGLTAATAGRISFDGTELAARGGHSDRRHVQVVFQDPYSSLSPRMTVHDVLAEPLRAQRASVVDMEAEIISLMEMVGLGTQHLWRRSHEFSGGQCQRIAIARALAMRPRLLILDEPTSALDVSVQARILVLLSRLQLELGLAYLLVTHDLAVVESLAHDVLVMYAGKTAERGDAGGVLSTPRHPYTEALLRSIPSPDPEIRSGVSEALRGDVPSATAPPSGCRFHPRCPHTQDVCRSAEPPLRESAGGRLVACHLSEAIYSGV